MPDTSGNLVRLHAFLGEWVGDEVLHPSPWNATRAQASARVTGALAVDGRVVVRDEARTSTARSERVHAVLGYDPHVGRYVLDRFADVDATSTAAEPARGGWDGETLTFVYDTSVGPLRLQYTVVSPDHHTGTLSYWETERGWQTALAGDYHRQTPDRPVEYRQQADAIARTYRAHGAAPEQAEADAWAIVRRLHGRA